MYSFDEAVLEKVRTEKAWAQDPKYFQKVMLSPSAAMKMVSSAQRGAPVQSDSRFYCCKLMHAQSGVEKGIATGGTPVEVMGLMLGRPHTDPSVRALVVTDVSLAEHHSHCDCSN
jgi:COP9 signalosome complex subunit 5